jgi:hypothetical protein
MLVCIVGAMIVLMTVDDRDIRQQQLSQSVAEAVDSSLTVLMKEGAGGIDEAEWIQDFYEDLLLRMPDDATIRVYILASDIQKGLLSVEVVEDYVHPNGQTGSVRCVKTAILERTM